jgi:hypothetical protein
MVMRIATRQIDEIAGELESEKTDADRQENMRWRQIEPSQRRDSGNEECRVLEEGQR